MKKFILLIVLSGLHFCSQAQIEWAIKAGGGTSWLAFPKVFLQDPTDANNTWEIAPAINSGTFYLGGEILFPINNHMGLRAELTYNYISGEVNVTEIITAEQARKLQVYNRLEIPILFSVKSADNFWFSLGPALFFNLGDNHGFEKAVNELAPNVKIDATLPIGIRARLAANIKLRPHLYLEVKFDYDLGKYFKYEQKNDTYNVRIAMQDITGGLTYLF